MSPKMTAAEIEAVIQNSLPAAMKSGIRVDSVDGAIARIRLPFRASMLRPGNRVSGPTLFAAADTAMYACVMAHIGPQVMAVTADMSLHFLRSARPGDVVAEARMVKLGRRLAVMEVQVRSGDEAEPAVLATGTYALP
jgi:uncharacterized protein (TIGR00369 family)